jgi:hypothetical protein
LLVSYSHRFGTFINKKSGQKSKNIRHGNDEKEDGSEVVTKDLKLPSCGLFWPTGEVWQVLNYGQVVSYFSC